MSTSPDQMRATLANLEAQIQREAAAEKTAAVALPAGATPAALEDLEVYPDTKAMTPAQAHETRAAYEADLRDLVRDATPAAAPNAAFIAELQQGRQNLGAKPSAVALQVYETELAAALSPAAFNGKIDTLPKFMSRIGTPMTEAQHKAWTASVAQARAEGVAASVSAEDRAAGYVAHSELSADVLNGYTLPNLPGVSWNPSEARALLSAARAAGMTQAQVEAAARKMHADATGAK
ncbi:MAG TPA: hypothetical protein VKC11_00660 [Steroidobacteraceae bacterium]|nr:hypothetical protein [Steroidobacteraceae bacterium]